MQNMLDYLFALCDLRALIVFGVVYCVVKCYLNSCPPKGMPPGPPIVPFIGNMNLLARNAHVHQTVNELGKKYGPIFSLQLGWYPAIVINDYNLLKEAFIKTGEQCSGRMSYIFILKFLPEALSGVISAEGDAWKAARRLCISSLRDFGMGKAIIEKNVLVEADNIIFEVEKQKGKPFQFDLLFNKAASNVICSILFGRRYEYKDPEFIELLENLATFMENDSIFRAPTIMIPCLTPFFIFSKQLYDGLKIWRKIEQFFKDHLKEHRENFNPENMQDFIDVFLDGERQNKEDTVYTESSFIRMVLDLLMAGTDTTSVTMNWAMLFMLRNPDVQDKCRSEIMEVYLMEYSQLPILDAGHPILGDTCGFLTFNTITGQERKPSMKDRDKMPYVEATLHEVLRLGNTVPLSITHSTEGSVVLNGYTIPNQTGIVADFYSIHLDPELWDDPKAFRPGRFINAEGKVQRPPHFIPFSIGRRACLAENLAKSELFLFFVSMIQKFVYTCEDINKLPTLNDGDCSLALAPGHYKIIANPV